MHSSRSPGKIIVIIITRTSQEEYLPRGFCLPFCVFLSFFSIGIILPCFVLLFILMTVSQCYLIFHVFIYFPTSSQKCLLSLDTYFSIDLKLIDFKVVKKPMTQNTYSLKLQQKLFLIFEKRLNVQLPGAFRIQRHVQIHACYISQQNWHVLG